MEKWCQTFSKRVYKIILIGKKINNKYMEKEYPINTWTHVYTDGSAKMPQATVEEEWCSNW
jgi:hypothetical protein